MRWTANFLRTSKQEQSSFLVIIAVLDQCQRPEDAVESDCSWIKEPKITLVVLSFLSSFSLSRAHLRHGKVVVGAFLVCKINKAIP